MTTIDPAARLTSTYHVDDLREFTSGDGPFASVLLQAPSARADSEHSLDVRWRNSRRMIDDTWPPELLAQLDRVVADLDHGAAAGFVILQRADGAVHVEAMASALSASEASVGDAPRLLEVIEHRQRTLPHIVVDTDRAGATVSAFVAGSAADVEQVEGDTEHIHRSRGGGWSHRRFQQRAENTWERNAGEVGDVVDEVARTYDPVLIALAGEVRATQFLHDALDDHYGDLLVDIEANNPDGIADAVLRALDDRHARFQVAIIERLRNEQGITDPAEVHAALAEGRVETLLVAGPPTRAEDDERRARIDAVSAAISAALATSAPIVVVPITAEMSGGVAALARW